MASEIIGCLA